jgi:hypothetical protein
MRKLTSAKIFFGLAVLLFVAKPFLGFTMFSRLHPPAIESIFVKAFTKRKLEDSENNKFSAAAIQKKLADPVKQYILRFSFLLSIVFPVIFLAGLNINNRFLRRLQLNVSATQPAWLLNGKLII